MPELEGVEIKRAHRVGGRASDSCPIVAKFSRYKDREAVVHRARQSFDKHSQYSVREDYTERVQLHRRELGKRMIEARSRGNYASLRFDKLVIEDSVYKYDDKTNTMVRIGASRGRQRGNIQHASTGRTVNQASGYQPRDHGENQSDADGASDSELISAVG